MRIAQQGETLTVSDLKELCAENCDTFRAELSKALAPAVTTIELDLSGTEFVDSCGLGALIGVYKAASRKHGAVVVRVLNPLPPVQQMFELTRLHRIFELVPGPTPAQKP